MGVDGLVLRRNASAPRRRRSQYFEMFVNRGLYHDGWMAGVEDWDPLGE